MIGWFDLAPEYRNAWLQAKRAYKLIRLFHDGCPQATVKKFYGLNNGSFDSLLCSMETHGFLIYQSDDSKLHTFENRALR